MNESALEALAEELGAVATGIERESKLRIDAFLADAGRRVAECELRVVNMERRNEESMSSVRSGDAGPQGERGLPGERGDVGPQGERGEAGPVGERGLVGDVGAPGERGEAGPAGERGEPGTAGERGIAGDVGAPGERGEAGPAGERGEPGAVGERGLAGDAGAQGERGEAGPAGERGITGEPGEAGPQGDRGLPGERGESGLQGERGDPGPAGERGERGVAGPQGEIASAEEWTDEIHYEGSIRTFGGATYQAVRDTAKAPPHADWRCLAAKGHDGRSFVVCGTYDPAADYEELHVVVLNGGSFVARRNSPGACPGEGWQLIASQGKRGDKGERGERGLKGDPAPTVRKLDVSDDGVLMLTNGDGSTVELDLYPLLSKLQRG